MAGGDVIRALVQGMLEEGLELDFLVAEDIGIRRAAAAVFGQKIFEDPFPVFADEIDGVEFEAEPLADIPGIACIIGGGAGKTGVGLLPVFHEHAADAVTLAL